MVLVDTSVWSLALRKKEKTDSEKEIVNYLAKQIRDIRLVVIGPIRQEILSGISDIRKFEELKQYISIFKDHLIETKDYELAAEISNRCRNKGIQGSHIDFLICAVALNNNFSILSLDKDFNNYQKHIPIILEKVV